MNRAQRRAEARESRIVARNVQRIDRTARAMSQSIYAQRSIPESKLTALMLPVYSALSAIETGAETVDDIAIMIAVTDLCRRLIGNRYGVEHGAAMQDGSDALAEVAARFEAGCRTTPTADEVSALRGLVELHEEFLRTLPAGVTEGAAVQMVNERRKNDGTENRG